MHFTGFEGTEQMLFCHGCIEIILTYLYYSLSLICICFSVVFLFRGDLGPLCNKIAFWTHLGPISGPKMVGLFHY